MTRIAVTTPPAECTWTELSELLREDPGGRGVASLTYRTPLRSICESLLGAGHVVLCTGFVHPGSGCPETDGPLGTRVLGDTLVGLGIPVTYLTDALTRDLLEALQALPVCVPALRGLAPTELSVRVSETMSFLDATHLVAIERAGRTKDGSYRSCQGEDISPLTDPLDELFLAAPELGVVTIGVGDGGNEIGMGKLASDDPAGLAGLTQHASVVATDHLVVAGNANRGAYALIAGLSLLEGADLLPAQDDLAADLEALVEAGAVDGVTGEATPSVDGRPLSEELAYLSRLRAIVAGALGTGG